MPPLPPAEKPQTWFQRPQTLKNIMTHSYGLHRCGLYRYGVAMAYALMACLVAAYIVMAYNTYDLLH